ncbi:hypothetical protein JCM11957_10680 [Caminibacter profundus]
MKRLSQLKEKVTSALQEYNLTFEEVSVLEFTGKEWITLQKGCSDEVSIMLIDGKIKLIKSL